ncbi:MAG: HD domain-containing protein [Lentimicrobiaceae bacterium]|nr:HD domain-containing protein [Lentimicrobiaceae bacterium]
MNTEKQYIILAVTVGTTRHGTPYARLKVADLDATFEISVWDISKDEVPTIGQRVYFTKIQFNKAPTMQKCFFSADKENSYFLDYDKKNELSKLLPTLVPEVDWYVLKGILFVYCTDEILKSVINEQMDRMLELYAEFPAGTTVHHAYKGGLLNHTYEALTMLSGIYPMLSFPVKIEHVILGLLFHDFGKTCEYTDTGVTEDYSLLGHIYIGANELNKILLEKNVSPAEIKRIVHCVLAHHGKIEHGSPVVPCTAEAFLVFHLDALSGHGDIYANATPGEYNKFIGTTVL